MRNKWINPGNYALRYKGGNESGAHTVIIDEASMIPMDLFGVLFRALDLNKVSRLILVGDPNQLPPIGPGRPFVDTIEWLKTTHPECVAQLNVAMRTDDAVEPGSGTSVALALAEGYRADGS